MLALSAGTPHASRAHLVAGELHVWSVTLGAPAAADLALLDRRERARAAQLQPPVAARFAAARVALRRLLAAYTGSAPQALRIVRGPHGKPALADSSGVHFNLSHSGSLMLVALAAVPVGVDVEAADRRCDGLRLARRFFSPEESAALAAMAGETRRLAFLRLWIRKEALSKLDGGPLIPSLRLSLDEAAAARWVQDIEPGEGWLGAVAAAAPPAALRVCRLDV